MTVPIIMLFLLVAPYGVLHRVQLFTERAVELYSAGLTLLFILTGIGHFTDADSMAQMLPPWVPAGFAIIYLTGVLEFVIAIGFLFSRFRRLTGWITATMLVLFFPANIYAAIYPCTPGRSCVGSRLSSHSCAAPTHYLFLGLLVHDSRTQACVAC